MSVRFLAAVAGLMAVLSAGPAAAFASSVPTLPVDRLHPGDQAVVRTVFQGSAVDTFSAEIVGVLPGGRAEGDLILARATSERVIHSGVAQGMSGSPVYVGGQLIGALSSGWSFSKDPLFGITPIGEMLRVLDQPVRADVDGSAGPGGLEAPSTARDFSFGPFRWQDEEPPAPAPPPSARPEHLALPLLGGGLRPEAYATLEPLFREAGLRLVPGGGATAAGSTPLTLEPGSAVAVDVLLGDLQLSAIGTVTYRDGNHVLLFGHPFFGAGEIRLPLSTAVITTIVANQESSFKLGTRGVEVGVATQDRRTAVAGELGGRARLMPIAVDVSASGRTEQRFRFRSIEDRSLAPQLVTAAAINSMLESGGSGSGQTLQWDLDLYRKGVRPLHMTDVTAGENPIADLAIGVGSPLRFLLNNPYERCVLDSVRLRLTSTPGRSLWTLRSARLLENAVRPGTAAHLRCELESWRGEVKSTDIPVRVPEEAPDGGYTLVVGGGAELSRYEAQHLPARYRPNSLNDAWRRFGDLRNTGALYVALLAAAPEVTRHGVDYPELPISALALLSSDESAGDLVRRGDLTTLQEQRVPVTGQLRGQLLLTVQVDRKAP